MLLAGAVVAQDPPADGPESDADRVESSFTTGFRDAIDASAPQDAKAANRLQLAESLIHKGQFERALEALLYTLDKADGAMVRLADGGLASVADEANRLMGSLPA
jgi:hypothetical protein